MNMQATVHKPIVDTQKFIKLMSWIWAWISISPETLPSMITSLLPILQGTSKRIMVNRHFVSHSQQPITFTARSSEWIINNQSSISNNPDSQIDTVQIKRNNYHLTALKNPSSMPLSSTLVILLSFTCTSTTVVIHGGTDYHSHTLLPQKMCWWPTMNQYNVLLAV